MSSWSSRGPVRVSHVAAGRPTDLPGLKSPCAESLQSPPSGPAQQWPPSDTDKEAPSPHAFREPLFSPSTSLTPAAAPTFSSNTPEKDSSSLNSSLQASSPRATEQRSRGARASSHPCPGRLLLGPVHHDLCSGAPYGMLGEPEADSAPLPPPSAIVSSESCPVQGHTPSGAAHTQ